MREKIEQILQKMDNLRVELMESIITHVWNKNIEDYGIEEATDGVWLADYYVSDADMRQIYGNEIPENVCFEYWDYHSLNYKAKWIKEAKKEDDLFLKTLYLFYKKRQELKSLVD